VKLVDGISPSHKPLSVLKGHFVVNQEAQDTGKSQKGKGKSGSRAAVWMSPSSLQKFSKKIAGQSSLSYFYD
jgi:hypothetical protein